MSCPLRAAARAYERAPSVVMLGLERRHVGGWVHVGQILCDAYAADSEARRRAQELGARFRSEAADRAQPRRFSEAKSKAVDASTHTHRLESSAQQGPQPVILVRDGRQILDHVLY